MSASEPSHAADDYDRLLDILRRRRSVRKFEPGRSVPRQTLERIAEAGRWAPSGANAQPWDFIIVDDPDTRDAVVAIFLEQARRLIDHARGFPAVMKSYLKNTVAIVLVVGDPRWKACFPQGTGAQFELEYAENNENIFYCSLGAAIQNIQLAVTSVGLTSAWLSGGGERTTSRALSELLGYPDFMRAYGTIPMGYPARDVRLRYRRPLEQMIHWNRYEPRKYRRQAQVDFYVESLRPFAMYRGEERMEDWSDAEEKLGEWKSAFTGNTPNPSGELED